MDHKSLQRFCLTTSFFCSPLIIDRKDSPLSPYSEWIKFFPNYFAWPFSAIPVFFQKSNQKQSPLAEPLQVRSEVAAVRWGRSGRVHGLEFTKKQMMRVERFKAQRNDGVRRTLTLHLLLFLCKQQQHSGQTWTGFCIWVIVFCDLPAVWFRCSRQIAAGICCVSPRLDASVALGGCALSFALGCQ